MKLKEAANRLAFRFKNQWSKHHDKSVVLKDKESFETVLTYLENQMSQKPEGIAELFAKLYITLLGEFMKYYKVDVFSNIPQKEIHRILDTNIHQVIQDYTKIANDQEIYLKISNGGEIEHPAIAKSKGTFKAWTKEEMLDTLEPVISEQEAEDNLVSMVNLAINKYLSR